MNIDLRVLAVAYPVIDGRIICVTVHCPLAQRKLVDHDLREVLSIKRPFAIGNANMFDLFPPAKVEEIDDLPELIDAFLSDYPSLTAEEKEHHRIEIERSMHLSGMTQGDLDAIIETIEASHTTDEGETL